jgi:hypothetical protein
MDGKKNNTLDCKNAKNFKKSCVHKFLMRFLHASDVTSELVEMTGERNVISSERSESRNLNLYLKNQGIGLINNGCIAATFEIEPFCC